MDTLSMSENQVDIRRVNIRKKMIGQIIGAPRKE